MNSADRLQWRVSSYSGNGENCVALAVEWRTSSYSSNGANCVQLATDWRTSSRSSNGESCVQLAKGVFVRDSKNPTGPILRADLAALVAAVKSGRLDG